MVAVQTILPEGSLQKGIISYPGHQHPPAIRATRNRLLRQANAYQATSQLLHQFAVFSNIIPAGLTALAIAKVSLKGANLFLGKYPKKLLIHIRGQHKDRFICNKRLQVQIGLPSRGFPHETDILTVISPLLSIAGKAMVESSQRRGKAILFAKGSQCLGKCRGPMVVVVSSRT